jgi:hypothetical protein
MSTRDIKSIAHGLRKGRLVFGLENDAVFCAILLFVAQIVERASSSPVVVPKI